MGVKGLNALIKKICGESHISHVPRCNFYGKKVAVDANLYICVFKTKSNYKHAIVEFLTMLRENGIHPFFVFDGEAPFEKKNERMNRSEKRTAQRERISQIQRDLDVYKETNEMSDFLKSIDFKSKTLLSPHRVSFKTIQNYIDRQSSYLVSITDDDFAIMKDILSSFGIPFTVAEGEGEFLCAALNRHGLVDAVYSADTDVLPCLAPVVINKLIDDNYFQVIILENILKGMKISEKQFIDLCIMCGTDFNQNIPKIGPINSYELIIKYIDIDSLPTEYDTNVLNFKRVREIFSYTDNKPDIEIPWCEMVDYDRLKNYTWNDKTIQYRLSKNIINSKSI